MIDQQVSEDRPSGTALIRFTFPLSPPLIVFKPSALRRQNAFQHAEYKAGSRRSEGNAQAEFILHGCPTLFQCPFHSSLSNFRNLRLPIPAILHHHHHYSGLAFISVFTALRATELHRPCSLLSDTRFLLQIHAPHHPRPLSTLTTIADFTTHSPPHPFSKFRSPTARSSSSFCQRNQRHQTHLRPLHTIPTPDCRL